MQVVHYTDPGCPFAFSAEPALLRLAWTFGDQLEWTTRLIVLARTAAEYEVKGITPTKLQRGYAMLRDAHGMPIDTAERARLAGTEPACLAVVGVRRHRADRELALLRALRVRAMGGDGFLDEPELIGRAATDAGLDSAEVLAWAGEPETATLLEQDRAAARDPLPAALALDHKLAPSEDGGRRYTAPSIELHHDGRVLVAPGFQPWESYDALVANLAPGLERRGAPESVDEVLAWAPWPLATAEVAAITGRSITDVRVELEQHDGATAVGDDYWAAG